MNLRRCLENHPLLKMKTNLGYWRNPNTREKLLVRLEEDGYDKERIDQMKELIDARDSDVYDVLSYVAYAKETMTRKVVLKSAFN